MNYCVTFYPTSGCLETCLCQATELGQILYALPRKTLLTPGLSLVVTPTEVPSLEANLTACISSCNEKCMSEPVSKKDPCVTFCVNLCKASYDISVNESKKV